MSIQSVLKNTIKTLRLHPVPYKKTYKNMNLFIIHSLVSTNDLSSQSILINDSVNM